jgi:hypothetical protein
MRLSSEFTKIYLEKRGIDPDLLESRTKFDALVTKEDVARRHAERLKDLARARTMNEDTSLGGYANTFMERMAPVPSTLTEAAVRFPLTGLAGAGGFRVGKSYESMDPHDLMRVLSPSNSKERKVLIKNLTGRFSPATTTPDQVKKMVALIREAGPQVSSRALRERSLPNAVQAHLPAFLGGDEERAAKVIRSRLGEHRVEILREELGNMASQLQKDKLLPTFRGGRWLGGAAGLALGTALTGLPFALRAMALKSQGGDAAVRSRARMQASLSEAEEASKARERILRALEAK